MSSLKSSKIQLSQYTPTNTGCEQLVEQLLLTKDKKEIKERGEVLLMLMITSGSCSSFWVKEKETKRLFSQ